MVLGDFVLHENFSVGIDVNIMEDLGITKVIKICYPILCQALPDLFDFDPFVSTQVFDPLGRPRDMGKNCLLSNINIQVLRNLYILL